MRILGIETSCDETGAAVIEADPGDKQVTLLSNVVASSLTLHAKTGGIIPEVAAREQIKCILPVIEEAVKGGEKIDAIAVTFGPGLIGSLLVGVETAKTLAFAWNKLIIPVNHLIGHIYANWIIPMSLRAKRGNLASNRIVFPALALIVSGGHTDLVLMKTHQQLTWIGGTRDDAAGEAFDKIGRLLDLPYPAGPVIAAEAAKFKVPFGPSSLREFTPRSSGRGQNAKFKMFPRPMIGENNFDFSFSGLKTAVYREVQNKKITNEYREHICAEVQQAIVDVLVKKTIKAAKHYNIKSILLSGGVAANDLLRKELEVSSSKLGVTLFAPPKNLCTDNAAMIASAAFFNDTPVPLETITAAPSLHF